MTKKKHKLTYTLFSTFGISKDNGNKNLIRNIGFTFVSQVVSAIFSVGLSMLVSRTLGPSGQGKYALIILFSSLLAQSFDLGVPGANVYFINRRETTPTEAFGDSLCAGFLISLSGGIVGTLLFFSVKNYVFGELSPFAFIASIPLYSILLLRQYSLSILQSTQEFISYNKVILTASVTTFLLTFASINLFGATLPAIITSSIAGSLASLIISLNLASKKVLNREFSFVFLMHSILSASSKGRARRIYRNIKYGWKIGFSNVVALLNYRIDVFLISYFMGVEEVGIYVIAVQIAEKLWFFSQSASTVIFPKLAKLHHSNANHETKKSLTGLTCKISALFTALSLVVTTVLAPKLIPMFFGTEFQQSVNALFFLFPGILFTSVSRILANDITARGKPELNLYSSLIMLLANVVLNILFIKRWGLVGAAVATSIAYFINVFLKTYIYVNYNSFDVTKLNNS